MTFEPRQEESGWDAALKETCQNPKGMAAPGLFKERQEVLCGSNRISKVSLPYSVPLEVAERAWPAESLKTE